MATTRKTKPAPPVFPVSKTSPFSDGYDIEAERESLRDLIDADNPNEMDPRYSRFEELERRESLLKDLRAAFKARDGAETSVPYKEASEVKSMGKLADDGEDSMLLHTRESSRLFIGRAVEPGAQGYGQSGGKRVGAALRAIWYLSGNDNPYADFALLEAHGRMSEIRQSIEKEIETMEAELEKKRQRGLSYSVVAAVPPAKVELGFRSPYGYAVVELIASFDYFVRLIKTKVRKDMLTDKEGYLAIYNLGHRIRSAFERVIWFQRNLLNQNLRTLSRLDWLPNAPDDARKRVTAAVTLFGSVPREVFNGTIVPPHSRRQLDVSAEELRLLNEVPLVAPEDELSAAASAALV